MNIPKLICILIFLISFSNINSASIKLEFKSGLCKGNENSEFLGNYYNQYIFTTISIGSNNQKLDLALKLNRYITYIIGSENSKLKSDFFNEKESNTYKILEEKEYESKEDEFFSSYKSSDNINFGNNFNINNYIFFLSQKEQYFDETGHIGFKILPAHLDKNKFISYSFISQLKSNKKINSQYFYFKYNLENKKTLNYNGYMLIGETPHEYEENDLFKEKNFNEIYTKIDEEVNTRWTLELLQVKYGNDIISKNDLCEFSTTFGFIVAPLSFFNVYEKFFSKNKCYGNYNGEKDDKNYIYFYCEENVDLTKFENIYLTTKNKEMNFVLDYNDLFLKIDNYYYFLILFNEDINEWILGHIFLNKYTIVFNPEKKTIGWYYDSNMDDNLDIKKNNNAIVIFIILSIIFLFVIIGLLVYIFYYRPKYRKIRPNELEENFDYSPKDNENIQQDNSKLGI